MKIKIKGWGKFQHYKNRKPPWIKLYRDLIDDMEFYQLSGDAAKLLIMLWVLASEAGGCLPDIKVIAFRFRMDEKKCNKLISELKHYLDIEVLADSLHYATPERETERETEREYNNVGTSDDVSLIISYLNELTGKKYRPNTEANKKLIRARMAEGYTVEDFKTVIKKKSEQWMKTESEQYLRPETLFRPSHFESYLNQPDVVVKEGDLFGRPQSDAMKVVTAKIPAAQVLGGE